MTTGEIGGRNHFTDFDLDAPEFSDNFDEVASAVHQGCPVARSQAQGGYWVNAQIDDFVEDGSCDWMDAFAAHVPGRPSH